MPHSQSSLYNSIFKQVRGMDGCRHSGHTINVYGFLMSINYDKC